MKKNSQFLAFLFINYLCLILEMTYLHAGNTIWICADDV